MTDERVCRRVGGQVGRELSCGEVEALLRPFAQTLAHPRRCAELTALLRATFAQRCCVDADSSPRRHEEL